METKIISSTEIGRMTVQYHLQEDSGKIGLIILPTSLKNLVVPRRNNLSELPYIASFPSLGNPPADELDVIVDLKIVGDSYPAAYAGGHTMRQSPSQWRFRYDRQENVSEKDQHAIVTHLKSEDGLQLEHRLSWHDGDEAFQVETIFRNRSSQPVRLEMLSSYVLGGLTPFHEGDAPNRLQVHRFRALWSAEGRLDTRSLEDLHLERSWTGSALMSERFGQVGSMPVRQWFPFVALEDKVAGATWAAQLAWAGSWQMEIFRRLDNVSLSGGQADREFGQWMKTVQPGEDLHAPPALLTCSAGGLDEACDNLTALGHRAANTHPEIEADLPIVVNEFFNSSWGHPYHDKLIELADRLKGSEVKYLMIDAGWYQKEKGWWWSEQGDWDPSPKLYPQGLTATADAIRERGLIPGLWFEMEICGDQSATYTLVDHLLQRDGLPLTTGGRRFLNLSDPWVRDFLVEKVIGLLRGCNFGYLKVDYNDTIGLGSDHPDSLGEGLRQQTEGTYWLFDKIRAELPDLVIENCASGGHRLEPSMIARGAMSSFSDAHEVPEIPILAASLQRLVLPRQLQMWAILQPTDDTERLIYSLAAGFLGRLCLSGRLVQLSDEQWSLARRAMQLYKIAVPIIKHGTSRRIDETGPSWRHPQGAQAVCRIHDDGKSILIVVHAFEKAPKSLDIPLPKGDWKITDDLHAEGVVLKIQNNAAIATIRKDFSASVYILNR